MNDPVVHDAISYQELRSRLASTGNTYRRRALKAREDADKARKRGAKAVGDRWEAKAEVLEQAAREFAGLAES